MSSEDFKSLIVTDPDLVDEGIDVSGLRTTTDTSPFLLGNIPDSPGIQYSTLAPTKYTDLMRLYSEGLPTLDIPQAAAPVTTAPDTGGGGQPTIQPIDTPITTDITSDQIDEFATPTNTGGITGDPIQMENIASNPYDIPMDIDDPGASIENIIAQNPSGTIEGAPVIFDINETDDPALNPGSTMVQGDDPYKNLPQEQQDPGFWETARDNFIQTGQDVGNFFKDLGSQGLDIGKLAGTTILNLAGKALTGIPLLGTAVSMLPERDPRQTALDEFYDVEDGTIQSGLMKDYNPVSGNPLDPNYGLQDAYQDRIDTIEDTLATKYPDGDYSETELDERLAQLKDAKAREKDLLDAVVTGAPQEDIGATDTISDLEIATGIQAADDDSGSDMLDTTITTDLTSDQIDEFDTTPVTDPDTTTVLGRKVSDGTTMADMTDDVDLDLFDTTPQDAPPVTGIEGSPSQISGPQITEEKPVDTKLADDRAVDQLSYDQIIEYENLTNKLEGEEIQKTGNPDIGLSKQEEIKNKAIDQIKEQDVDEFSDEEFMVGDTSTAAPTEGNSGADNFFDAVDKSVTGTTKPGTKTEPTYQDAIMRGQTGGGSDPGSSKSKIVCTMMNESYGFGSFRNKIWMKFHKDLSPEYQKGYHKLFLPLVKIAKTNKVVKKVLEHIAVHSTIDMRQATRGKTHLLGRVYRKILLPLCYWVGKNAKR